MANIRQYETPQRDDKNYYTCPTKLFNVIKITVHLLMLTG